MRLSRLSLPLLALMLAWVMPVGAVKLNVGTGKALLASSKTAPVPNIPITLMTLGEPYKYNTGYPTKYVQSDVWANSCKSDGTIYSASDDTVSGWSGANASANTMISTWSGFTPAMTGTIVNNMTAWGTETQLGSDGADFKSFGFAWIDGVLYDFVSRQTGTPTLSVYGELTAQLIKSTDSGATFLPAPPSTAQPYVSPTFTNTLFSAPTFIQYGCNYTGNGPDNSSTYVYAVSNDGAWNNGNTLQLGRVKRTDLAAQDPTKWQWFNGTAGSANCMADSNWSGAVSAATPTLSSANKLSTTFINYIPAYGRYFMPAWHYPSVITSGGSTLTTSDTKWELYEAPHPCGPWTLFQTIEWTPQGLYNPNIVQASLIADGGKTGCTLVASGDFTLPDPATGLYTLWLIPCAFNPPTGCPQSVQWLARTTGMPAPQRTAAEKAICGIVTDGNFAALDFLYLLDLNSTATAALNVISESYTVSWTSLETCTFTANLGLTGDGSACFGNTNFTPSTAAGNMTRDSSSLSTCVVNSRIANQTWVSAGASNGSSAYAYIQPLASGATGVELNGFTFPTVPGVNAQGAITLTRTASTGLTVYRNGTSIGTPSDTSVALPNQPIYLLAFSGTGAAATDVSGDTLAYAFGGAGLTQTQVSNIGSRLSTMMTELGQTGCVTPQSASASIVIPMASMTQYTMNTGTFGSEIAWFGNGAIGITTNFVAPFDGWYTASFQARAGGSLAEAAMYAFVDGAEVDHGIDAVSGSAYVWLVTAVASSPYPSSPMYLRAGPHFIGVGCGNCSGGGVNSLVTGPLTINAFAAPAPAEPGGNRDPTIQPLRSYNVWNTAVGSGAFTGADSDADNAQLIAAASGAAMNSGDFSIPVYVASILDPLGTFAAPVQNVLPFYPALVTQIPSSVTPAPPIIGGDHHITLFDDTHLIMQEFEGCTATVSPSGFGCDFEAINSVCEGRDSAGIWTPGLIRISEIQNRLIPHMLRFSLPLTMTKPGIAAYASVWPQSTIDSCALTCYTGNIPAGSTIYIPPTVNINSLGLTADGLAVAKALQDYGAMQRDTGGTSGAIFYAETAAETAVPTQLTNIRADLPAIAAQLRVMRNQAPTSINGGGTPRQPAPPRIGICP